LVKRSAFALGFLFLLFILELILMGNLKDTNFSFISDFTPLNAMWGLIPEPFTRLDAVSTAAKTLNADISSDYGVSIVNVITVLIWTFLFVYGAFALLKKRDL
jgi:hypothetical protein